MAINKWRKAVIWTALSAGILFLISQSFVANFYYFADPVYPYVYSHTIVDIFKITNKSRKVASAHPDKNDMYIQVIFPDHNYWPLPWYLREFNKVAYQNKIDPTLPAAPVILASPKVKNELLKKLYELPPPGNKNLYIPLFPERVQLQPSVEIIGFITNDLNDMLKQQPE
jgi:hypothetical protein